MEEITRATPQISETSTKNITKILYDPIIANQNYLAKAVPGTIMFERIHTSPTAMAFNELTRSFKFKCVQIHYLINPK